jgi:hypothetical protein
VLPSVLLLLLVVPYALLNYFFPGPLLTYTLGTGIALVSLVLLRWLGVRSGNPFRVTRPSRPGAILLSIPLLYLPLAVAAGRIQLVTVDQVLSGLISGVPQELYFRWSLIIGLQHLLGQHSWLVLGTQAALFGLWHARAFAVVDVLPAMAVVAGTTVAGLLWGLEARRDRTILYVAVEHSLLLILQ